MTIGDVLAVIAAVGLLGVTLGATLLLTALALPAQTGRAAAAIAAAPGRCLGRGLGVLLTLGLLTLVLIRPAAGPARPLGVLCLAALALAALLGGAGLARLVGERIQGVGTRLAPFAALTRASALCVLAGLTPLVGWFLLTPLALLLALGGAASALRPAPSVSRRPALTVPEVAS